MLLEATVVDPAATTEEETTETSVWDSILAIFNEFVSIWWEIFSFKLFY
ncbi:MAG: hypothetical protein R3Y27_03405 [Clostridia bacterium]